MNAVRFPAYAEELREFSASHGVACGAPEDLRGLVAALETGGEFSGECASMLRSVVYRERGEADAGSLLMLVTGVWGGLTEPEAGIVPFLRQFVSGAMRAPKLEEVVPIAEQAFLEEFPAEYVAHAEASEVDQVTAVVPRALSEMEVESALRELEARSPDVRLYRELLERREAALGAVRVSSGVGSAEGVAARAAVESRCAFANGFDPWDESSELQQELRRFAEHRERMLALEAEEALRPLHAKLLGGAESALVNLLGRDNPLRRGFGLRWH